MSQAYIIDGTRTAIGKFGGTLSSIRPDNMAAHVISELIKRNPSIDPNRIEDVIFGAANQAGEDNRNVARMGLLLAGLPQSIPGITVNRLCASGLSATVSAFHSIKAGEGQLFITGGAESMSRAPFVMSKAESAFSRKAALFDTSIGWRFVNPKLEKMYGTHSMGETAENLAEKFKISREDQDKFALNSQLKAASSQESGRFAKEITAIEIPQRKKDPIIFEQDEFIRAGSTIEALAKLKPAFRSDEKGSVTAGNSSGVNDGAAALLIASEQAVSDFKLKPLAQIVASASSGVEPKIMGIGPVEATRKALSRADLSLDQIGVIELNEAFAVQSLACMRELGLEDDDPRVNPNGGAIALGHPLGMSGARLLLSASLELHEKQEKYALCTMCVGVGQGVAAILERA